MQELAVVNQVCATSSYHLVGRCLKMFSNLWDPEVLVSQVVILFIRIDEFVKVQVMLELQKVMLRCNDNCFCVHISHKR